MKRKIFSVLLTLVLLLSFSLVTAAPAAAADITVGSSGDHATIQAAIDAASPGDTIIVAGGTYTEDLTVNIANLTLKSESGAGSTTIQLVDGVGIDIQGGASDFTLGGASGEGFTILNGAATTFNIQLANAPSDVEISHNTINTVGNASMGISVGAAGASGLIISNNSFTAEAGDGSIWGPNVVDVTVSNNTLIGGAYAIQFSGVTGTISNNTISASSGSGAIVISNGAGTSGLTISGNNISSCTRGIRFVEYCAQGTAADMTTVTVTENALTGNDIGLLVGNGTHVLASNFTIDNNNFSGNNVALQNDHASEQVTAADNWWGDASGPAYPPENPGLGDPVSVNVIYCPWLNAAYPGGAQVGRVLNETQATVHCTIQDALNNATAGDLITAATGTYTEDLTVNTANLTLRSQTGMANTTIQLVTGVGIDIMGGADGFTLGGAAGQGFTVKSSEPTSTTFAIQLANAPSGVEISYNTINTEGPASMGISVGAAGATGLTVDNNDFTCDEGDIGIWGPGVVDVAVTNNDFDVSGASSVAIEFAGVTSTPGTSVISGNTIDNYDGYAAIGILTGEATSDLTISGNTINNCINAIRFGEYAQQGDTLGMMEDVTVSGNTLYNNTTGVYVDNSPYIDTSNFVIDGNSISHNNPDGSKGVWFKGGQGGTISGNIIRGNYRGIQLDVPVSQVVIIDNCVIENDDGIRIEGCHNIIGTEGHGNVISGNVDGLSGVHLTDTAFGNVINYNDIAFNYSNPAGGFGVFNENSVPVDATNNWWGHVDGPSMGFIPFEELPAGDTISQHVAYEPWATSPLVDAVAPAVTYAAASPEMVSIWFDEMMPWGEPYYSVGPDYTVLSVKASDDLCGIARVTKDLKQLLLDLIPEEKLQKFIDREYEGDWDAFWADMASQMEGVDDLEAVEMDYDSEYGCWYEEEYINDLLYYTFYNVLDLDSVEVAEIMGQELQLGDHQIEVTACDYSGNSATGYIYLTIVDFQMPVCEGWNLRSTWLWLENNSVQDIVATMDEGNVDTLRPPAPAGTTQGAELVMP